MGVQATPRSKSFAILALLGLSACTPPGGTGAPAVAAPVVAADAAAEPVRNIILLIADGTGAGLWTAAEASGQELAVKRMPVTGWIDTRSAHHKVTDSAAGASVLATGERGMNRTLSVAATCPLPSPRDPVLDHVAGCEPLESWFEVARRKGKATGLVTTTYVVDATPAAFVAHSPSRYWYDRIAEQYAAADLDVLLGGGSRYFAADTRADGRDLLGPMCARSACLSTAAELAAYRPDDRPLVGLFAPADMDDLEPRPVSYPAMVAAALAKLERDPDGFVAVFETETPDNLTHVNAPLEPTTESVLEFDRGVGVALDFARRTPGTLVIATSDHETGGYSLVETGQGFELKYTTRGHTAELIPLFAAGPGAEAFGGFRENYEIGRRLKAIVAAW